MADYTYDSELVADPFTFQRAANSAITIYDVADQNNVTPLALKDLNGLALPNPLTSNDDAFVPAFVAPSAQVKMVGGGLQVVKASFQGVKAAADASAAAAEASAADAAEAALLAQAPTDAQVDAGVVRANLPALAAAAVSNAPAVVSAAATMAQSAAGLIPLWKASTSYVAGQRVVAPNGDVVSAKANFTSTATYAAANWNPSTQDGRIGTVETLASKAMPQWKPSTAYTVGQMVISPNGDVVSAKTAHTSTATYAPPNWDLTTAATALANSIKKGGVLADGTDVNALRTPGIYTVATSASAATMLNLPFAVPGEIWVGKNDNSNMTTQHAIGRPSTGKPLKFTRTALSLSAWDSWDPDSLIKGLLPDNTNVATFRTPGIYIIRSGTSAATMTGLPQVNGAQLNAPAILHVITTPSSSTGEQKIIYAADADGKYKKFSRVTISITSWPEWQDDTPTPAAPPASSDPLPDAGGRHAYLQQMAYLRRGPLGVQGKAVVSIRFDHWLNDMRAKVMPLMEKYMLCGSICLNADNMGIKQNLGTTWQQVTDMALFGGVEIWNHAADHLPHTDPAGIIDTIVGGQERLQSYVGPKLIVDGFMGNGSSYYDGYDLGRGFGAFLTLAGKAIRNSHAFSDGKNSGFMQPLDGKIKLGVSHYSVESTGSAVAIDMIEATKKNGRGLTIYMHPGLIDQPGGFVLADLEVLFAYLAAERDAGRIEILTVSGMGVADATHSRREDLLTNTQFTDSAAGWGVGSGWTFRMEGGKQLASASGSAGQLYQIIGLYTRFGWALGGMCELVVPARATGGVESTLRLQIHDTGTDGEARFKKERLFTLPADGSTKWCRIFVTMPADRSTSSIKAIIGREAGGALELMDEPHLRPV